MIAINTIIILSLKYGIKYIGKDNNHSVDSWINIFRTNTYRGRGFTGLVIIRNEITIR